MSRKLPVDGFKWVEKTFQYVKDYVKNYNEDIDVGYFLEIEVQLPEKLHELHNDLPFLPERMKTEKVEEFVANLHYKKNMLST